MSKFLNQSVTYRNISNIYIKMPFNISLDKNYTNNTKKPISNSNNSTNNNFTSKNDKNVMSTSNNTLSDTKNIRNQSKSIQIHNKTENLTGAKVKNITIIYTKNLTYLNSSIELEKIKNNTRNNLTLLNSSNPISLISKCILEVYLKISHTPTLLLALKGHPIQHLVLRKILLFYFMIQRLVIFALYVRNFHLQSLNYSKL